MTLYDYYVFVCVALSVVPLLSFVVYFLWCWYQDYKKWKFHKNRSRPLNPWSDW
ncbi:TPA: hypothetical protein PRO20_000467 [Acinetobacter baumannii]|nr:hypothetical protein [Acinetobacter baumannii]